MGWNSGSETYLLYVSVVYAFVSAISIKPNPYDSLLFIGKKYKGLQDTSKQFPVLYIPAFIICV